MKEIYNVLSEVIYILCGLVSLLTAYRAITDKNQPSKIGTSAFWIITGFLFIGGKYVPSNVVGALILVLGVLTATKQVKMGKFTLADENVRKAQAAKFGGKIFIPALMIGVIALVLSTIKIGGVTTPGAVSIGVAGVAALIAACILVKPKVTDVKEDTSRLLMQVGAASLLPQLLAGLGVIFTKSGVGDVISGGVSGIVPEGNVVIGVIIYVIAMMIFTMIMGNAFAAFTVITVGVGIPFVIAQGGNPAVIGSLGLTAGYCGTLITPMAANFNIVPGAVLETTDKNTIIKTQLPVALAMAACHVVLMLVLGF